MHHRAPAKHPRTGKPSARIEKDALYWFGVRVGEVRADDGGVALDKVGGDTDRFPSKVALLKAYGRRRVHALLAEADEFRVLHLGDDIGPARAVPGGYVFAGRFYGSLKATIAAAAENRDRKSVV